MLLTKHSLLVFGNLGLITRDLVPVDLTSASVHRCFVEALMVLSLGRYELAKDLGVILVPVVELGNITILRTLGRIMLRHTRLEQVLPLLGNRHNTLEPDVVFYK